MYIPEVLLHESPPRLLQAAIHRGSRDFPLHRHSCWELIYQAEGRVKTAQGEEVFDMHPGMVLLHAPGVPHRDIADEPYRIVYIWLEVAEAPVWPRCFYDDGHRTFGNLCEALVRETDRSNNRLLDLMVEQLALLLGRQYSMQAESPIERKIAEARRILEATFDRKEDLEGVAARVGMSRSSFFAHFATLHGQSPHEYLRGLRLRSALSLLRHSEFTLETIAERCGYCSASHLSRHIKAETGKRPGELRQASQR